MGLSQTRPRTTQLTQDWLLRTVWGEGYAGDVDVLRVFVSQLRKKIEIDPARPAIILTEPGVESAKWWFPVFKT